MVKNSDQPEERITEDLFKERERSRALTTTVEGEVGKLSEYLDNCLKES